MLCNRRVAERDQLRRVRQLELAGEDGVQPLALDQKQREGDHQVGQADEGQRWPFGQQDVLMQAVNEDCRGW